MPTFSFRRHLRPLLLDAAILAGLCVALLAPSASRAALISQTLTFNTATTRSFASMRTDSAAQLSLLQPQRPAAA